MKWLLYLGVVLNALMAVVLEIAVVIEDPWQLLNPFIQFKVAYYWVLSPIVWLGTTCILISLIRRRQ